MIKPTKTKAQVRDELDAQIAKFLSNGGDVKTVESGTSGIDHNKNIFAASTHFTPKETRTPLNGLVRELDERKKRSANKRLLPKRPRKKLIIDDFGEPVRWVWEE